MYSRAAFDRQREQVKQISSRDGRVLAVVAVGLGVAQLAFLRWAEPRMEDDTKTAIAGVAFLVYAALVAVMIWRMDRRVAAARPVCPHCGQRLKGLAERVASATGRCDACGAQVIE